LSDNDLNDMMLFIAVIDAGSFTLAAERLMIPKANLSRKISRLEARLGITLIERTTRTQNITDAGSKYLEHCRRIQQEAELAQATIEEMLNKVGGTLKIGASVGIGHEILKAELGQFMMMYPDINMRLELLNRRVDLIEEGFDLVIRIGELDDSRLVAKRLGQINRKLYASSDYLDKNGKVSAIEQVALHDFLFMNSVQNNEHLTLISSNEEFSCKLKPKAQVDDFSILKQLVIDGVGIAVLPDYMCQASLDKGELITVLPKWGMPAVDVYALYPKNRIRIPKVKIFMNYIQDVFERKLCI